MALDDHVLWFRSLTHLYNTRTSEQVKSATNTRVESITLPEIGIAHTQVNRNVRRNPPQSSNEPEIERESGPDSEHRRGGVVQGI